MLPELADLLDGFELYAQRTGTTPTRNERAIGDAIQEAERLANGRERDEAAALFFALARRPGAFGRLHGEMLLLVAAEQAHAVGLELRFEPIELVIHRIRILRGEMSFSELRSWFAARLRPIKRRPWPPK
jgi:hypothetical protein